jgi:hypothetical protein
MRRERVRATLLVVDPKAMGRSLELVATDSRRERGATKQARSATKSLAGWRRWLPWVLVVVAAVILLVSALNIWVTRQALSTDNWTNSSSQLLENAEIRNALSVYLVDQVYENVDVTQVLADRLPPRTKGLAAPLAAALQQPAVRTANALFARPRVQALWEQANRKAHTLFMAVVDGKQGVLNSTNGNVVLDLRPLIQQLVERDGLGSRVAQKLPPDAGQIVIMKGNQLETARKGVKVIRALSFLLFFLVLGLFALAVFIARGRRRTVLLGIGASVFLVGLLILVARRFGGDYLVNALTSGPESQKPVSAVWAIETNLLRNVGINAVIYGALAIVAAWIAGPARAAASLRRRLAPVMREHPAVIYGAVAFGLLIILLTGPTDGQRIYPLLVVFGLVFVGTGVLRRQTLREFPAG